MHCCRCGQARVQPRKRTHSRETPLAKARSRLEALPSRCSRTMRACGAPWFPADCSSSPNLQAARALGLQRSRLDASAPIASAFARSCGSHATRRSPRRAAIPRLSPHSLVPN
eukprot:6186590-Pleurochrysis_carterae.AAC.1